MFATSGYFKGVDCPYYLSGLCERPYCHLRHVKRAENKDASTFGSTAGFVGARRPSSPAPGSTACSGPTGSKPVGSGGYLKETGPSGQIPSLNGSNEGDEEYSVSDNDAAEGPVYEPTPKYDIVGADKKRRISTDCLYQPGGPAVEVPEYEPNHVPGSKPDPSIEYKPGSVPKESAKKTEYTPSALKKTSPKAKKRKAVPPSVPVVVPEYVPSSVPQYNPTPITQLKKMKKRADTDLEYDPVNNFVVTAKPPPAEVGEVVYVPSKRAKIDNNKQVPDMSVNINDFGDSDVISDDAMFSSDDDLDKSELLMDSGRYESPLDEDTDDEVNEIFSVKPFFKDIQSVAKASDKKIDVSENELNHPVRKPAGKDKSESDHSQNKTEPNELKVKPSGNKSKDKSEKSNLSGKLSSQSASQKHTSKNSCDTSSITKSSKSGSSRSSSKKSSSNEKKTHSSSSSIEEKSKHKKNNDSKSHSSTSNKVDKDSTKSSSSEKKHSASHISSSQSQNKHKSSSKDISHQKDSKEGILDGNVKRPKDSKNNSSAGNSSNRHSPGSSKHSSSSSNRHGHHSSKTGSKETKTKHEKPSSTSHTSSSKEKTKKAKELAHINADLFGSESEEEAGTSSGVSKNHNGVDMSAEEMAAFLEDSDFECDDGDTFEECLRIFNEDRPPAASNGNRTNERKKEAGHEPSLPGKKRVARERDSRASHTSTASTVRAPVKISAAQVMHNRLAEMQRRALEAAESRLAQAEAGSSSSKNTTGKSRLSRRSSLNDRDEDKRTVSITVQKGQKRKAHNPTLTNIKRPTIPTEFGSKVPSNIRQRYMNLIIDECLKICKSEEGAYEKGQEEEAAVYKRATNKNIYLRVAVNAIKRLRVEAEQAHPQSSKASPYKVVKQSHEAMLGGKNATRTTFTMNRSGVNKGPTDDFRGAELYKRLSSYILTEELMKENGFPMPSPEGGSAAMFYKDRGDKDVILKPHEKNCVRCGKRFIVFPNGNYNRQEECVYHWGKAWKKRVDRAMVSSYNCCGGFLDAEGCQVCKCHVYESNKYENVTGYMKTIPTSPAIDGDYGVYAMDCEMVYTKGGMELARVTVIDPQSKPVYETLVKPAFPVVDYNTRFSGVTEEDMQGVHTTLRDVQAVLLSLLTDKTILMGHSLESDLISVKIIHRTVIDTSVVFPHRLGPPCKRALRNLMVDYLKKIIQDDVGGHDSKEDAIACMLLMHWKLKEDAKKEIRRV